jgi:hypothetical protein
MQKQKKTYTSPRDYIRADELALGRVNDALGALASLISQASDSQEGPQLTVDGGHLASLILLIKQETTRAADGFALNQ